MKREALVGMPVDKAHAWMLLDGWIMEQPFSDYRVTYRSLGGDFVRYHTSLHDDGIERIDGIDYSANGEGTCFESRVQHEAEGQAMLFAGGSSIESAYERAAFLRGARWMFTWILNKDKTFKSNAP
jgi:hypothetical protein